MTSKDQPVHIIGAGLAGLTAAIVLAKQGREVIVYEKGNRVGGLPLYNPSPHGTPMNVEAMNRYVGFDLRPGLVEIADHSFISAWGKRYPLDFPPNAQGWMIERGPRKHSMDHYLADLARSYGARIEVGHPMSDREQISLLPRPAGQAANHFPRNVIVATGLHQDGFEVAHMPFQKLYGVFAKCRVPWPEARVTVYFDDYSPDYAFTCSVNGIAFGLIFNRHRPVEEWEAEKFRKQATEVDGYPFRKWMPLGLPGQQGAAAPTAHLTNPRLFHEDLILAGTLSGMMDPILFFGMHGAFLSGKIAAMALDDPVAANAEFKRLNATFKPVLAGKKLMDSPLFPRNVMMKYPMQAALPLFPLVSRAAKYGYMVNISGYNRF